MFVRNVSLLLIVAVIACAPSPSPATPPAAAPAPADSRERPSDRDTRSDAELEALFWARADSARMRFTDADVHFVSGMIGHHAQALVMARMAPSHGASPSSSEGDLARRPGGASPGERRIPDSCSRL